jgi:hypothetical protein
MRPAPPAPASQGGGHIGIFADTFCVLGVLEGAPTLTRSIVSK